MKFDNLEVGGFRNAIRGMRHPLESYAKSDSLFGLASFDNNVDYRMAKLWLDKEEPEIRDNPEEQEKVEKWVRKNGVLKINDFEEVIEYAFIGPEDMKLAKKLIAAGPEHCKFLRQIHVSFDITAPLYVWKEIDTYKISTTTNSTSTMHKLATTPITMDCFELDDYSPEIFTSPEEIDYLIQFLEGLRLKYLETKDKRYWKELIRWLPESWLQTRTWSGSYATVRNMRLQRKGHKLTEWHQIRNFFKTFPYADDFIFN